MATARTLKRWTGHGARVNAVEFGGTEGSVVVTGTSVSQITSWVEGRICEEQEIMLLNEPGIKR